MIEENVRSISDLETAVRSHESMSDRIASHISGFCGSMVFVWVHIVFFTGWILLNSVLLPKAFDPFPFTFLTFVVSLEAIFLSTFILIAENRQEQVNERRSKLDLQINLLAEQESTKTLQILEAIARKLEVDVSSDPTVQNLKEAVDPKRLARKIEKEEVKNGDGKQ